MFVKQGPLNPVKLQHSHLKFISQELDHYVRVFCMRRIIVDCILSFILCEQFRTWHSIVDEPAENYQPFEFGDWSLVTSLCESYCEWHKFYQPQLRSQDLVVYLEDLKTRLPTPCPFFRESYPHKINLISNYDEVVDCVAKFLPRMQESSKRFAQHINAVDVYGVIV